jgi:papain like protease
MPKNRPSTGRILNCLESPKMEQDWGFSHAAEAGVLGAPARLPASKDLRAAWWAIADQKATGSCVGWASADGLLRWHFVTANRLAKDEPLSIRFQWMAAKETDEFVSQPTTFIETEGTSLKSALDIARKYGAVLDADLPFGSAKLFPGDAKTFYAMAAQLKVRMYFNLGRELSNWRSWIATNGPILTRLGVDSTWDDADRTKGNLDTYYPETVRGGHAVALVGYTSDRFMVRNSWGTQWGDKGFGYASLAYAEDAFTEAYGIAL